jgi:hypothetical protein
MRRSEQGQVSFDALGMSASLSSRARVYIMQNTMKLTVWELQVPKDDIVMLVPACARRRCRSVHRCESGQIKIGCAY